MTFAPRMDERTRAYGVMVATEARGLRTTGSRALRGERMVVGERQAL